MSSVSHLGWPEASLPRYLETERFSRIPRRMLVWLYSISLVILVVLTAAFVAVTPIDVVVHTTGTSLSGIKLFIVIIVCVVYVALAFFLYISRLYQNRVLLNEIPSKSVYVPEEGDLPKSVYRKIQQKLEKCIEIKAMAGPLTNPGPINHPGMAPPDYIQERNHGVGCFLPPNTCYEDIVRSLALRIRMDQGILSRLPLHYTFGEMMDELANLTLDNDYCRDQIDVARMVELYEKFKFSGEHILEHELLEFMVELNKVAFFLQTSVESVPHNVRKYSTDGYEDLLQYSYGKSDYSESSLATTHHDTPTAFELQELVVQWPESSLRHRHDSVYRSPTQTSQWSVPSIHFTNASADSVVRRGLDDDVDVYKFRRRPAEVEQPSPKRPSPQRPPLETKLSVSDVSIRRLRSPERRKDQA